MARTTFVVHVTLDTGDTDPTLVMAEVGDCVSKLALYGLQRSLIPHDRPAATVVVECVDAFPAKAAVEHYADLAESAALAEEHGVAGAQSILEARRRDEGGGS